MSRFGDVRDWIAQMPNVAHGHATQGESKEDGPGTIGYGLYEARADILRCILELRGPTNDAGFLVDEGPAPVASIFEFGCLSGYCVAALGMSASDAGWVPRIGWCDDESTEPGSNERARENLASLGLEASYVCTNRRDAPLFGRAHLVCVDGDHSYENTLDDIAVASLLKPGAVLVDDCIPSHQPVINATNSVAGCFWDLFFISTVNGLGVLDATGGLRGMMTARGWEVRDFPL